jgi:acyl-CoA dehydrogenase
MTLTDSAPATATTTANATNATPATAAPAAPPVPAGDDRAVDRFVPLAADLGRRIAPHAAAHDRDGSFVDEGYAVLKEAGYLALAVPTQFGGMGATIAQVAAAQAELAKHCASTALASAMHLHVTLFGAWRHRRDMPGAEKMLRRVVDEGLVVVSTGGNDWTEPNGTAVPVEGGWKVNGRKVFASQSPVGDVLSTAFTHDDPETGRRIIGMSVPVRAPGVEIVETWDSMGMRGTGSHDVVLTDVFVPEAAVVGIRPWGVMDPGLQDVAQHAMPVVTAVYLGVAEGARDHALAAVRGTARAEDPSVQRLAGLLDGRLRAARWTLFAATAELGDDPTPSMERVTAIMQAKRAVAEAVLESCDLALQIGGGASYARRGRLEQAVRDVRGILYHPFTPEATILKAGRHALGLEG